LELFTLVAAAAVVLQLLKQVVLVVTVAVVMVVEHPQALLRTALPEQLTLAAAVAVREIALRLLVVMVVLA